ncbi:Ig-like domain-containing protein [Myxococcus hansupus]|nr:Ig-like domain-containing protein [Myxococcus hansupus]
MNLPERFFPPPWTAAVVLLCASACINVPAIESAETEVRITSPVETAYTNGVLEFRLAVTGHAPERVELLKNGEVLAELAPPYVYTWDTAGEAEGTYRLEARAVLGDTAFVSASRDVVVDRTPPQVVSRVPEPGAQEVWVQSPIRAEFSEPMKRSTVTTESVHLRVGELAVAHTVSLSEDGRTVTVTPVTALTAPSTVELSVTGALTDLAGNAAVDLGAAWGWVVPEFVPYPFHPVPRRPWSGAARAQVRLDPNGNPVVMTHYENAQGGHLSVSRWTGEAWQQLGSNLKTSPDEYELHHPNLQLSPDGNPIVAWQEDMGAEFNNYVHVAQWTGEDWKRLGGEQGIIPDRPHARSVSLQLTRQGQPVVAINMDWEDIEGGTIHVYQFQGSNWTRLGSPVRAAPTSETSTPTLALDLLDRPVVAFYHSGESTKLFAQRWNGTDFESLGNTVNPSGTSSTFPKQIISFNQHNQPIITWSGQATTGSTTNDFFSSHWVNNQWVWLGTPPKLSAENDRSVHGAYCSPDETLIVSFVENNAGISSLTLSHRTNETWEKIWSSDDAFRETNFKFHNSSMASDAQGNIVLSWTERHNDHQDEILVYRKNQQP